MEVFRRREALADQCRADYALLALDQAAIGLRRKQQLAEAGDDQGIQAAGEQTEKGEQNQSGTQMSQHGMVSGGLQTMPMATTARSISLMPMKGATMPPSP